MLCHCGDVAIAGGACSRHFIESYLAKVKDTIERYGLIRGRPLVAVSGGKDSLACLDAIKQLGFSPEALLIDEGISGYRKDTIHDMQGYVEREKIPYRIVTFAGELGTTLDSIEEKNRCSVCGVFRRYLLNKHAEGYDVIATGHNMDDEAQAILMNLLRSSKDMYERLGPKSGGRGRFTQRVKPLYFCTEKENLTYTLLRGIKAGFHECPYVKDSYRAKVRDFLYKEPGMREKLIKAYLSLKKEPSSNHGIKICKECGEPSSNDACMACRMLKIYIKK